MDNRLRVGFVGWLFDDDTEYARTYAACDIDRAKLGRFASKHPGVKAFTDYREMARDPALDAVVISTPNWLHCEMAEAFLAKGCHVFCEKPMGIDRAEMDRMLRAQRASGRQLAIDFEMRASAATSRIREIALSGEIGRAVGFEFVHHRGCWLAEGSMLWRVKPEKSGGLFFMEVCHEVDFMRWLLGEATHVQSFATPNVLPQYESGMPDNVFSHFWFESGAIGHLSTTHTLSAWDARRDEYGLKGHDMFFVVTGTGGALRYDAIKGTLLVVRYEPYPEGSGAKKPVFDRVERFDDSHAAHDITANRRAFLRACAEGRPHHQDALDAWRTHVACLAAEDSLRRGSARAEIDYSEPAE